MYCLKNMLKCIKDVFKLFFTDISFFSTVGAYRNTVPKYRYRIIRFQVPKTNNDISKKAPNPSSGRKRSIFARPALTGLPFELGDSTIWQAWPQKRQRRGQVDSAFIYPSIPTWATSLCNKWFSTASGCQRRIRKKKFDMPPLSAVCTPGQCRHLGLCPPFLISEYATARRIFLLAFLSRR